MRFKVKVVTDSGKEKIEFNNAVNEKELRKIYKMMGYTITDILDAVKESKLVDELSPEQLAKLRGAGGGVPNMGGGVRPSPVLPVEPPAPEYKEYTDNGVKYRVESHSAKMQKQDWVKLDNNFLKELAIEADGKMSTAYAEKIKLYKLEWVDLG